TSVVTDVRVEVGRIVPQDVKLEVGGAAEEVNVIGTAEAQVDRIDNTVAGVVNTRQIQNLPLNGRNFLDLAQLQPGTERVDGGSFDPTKANYTGVSIAGQAGRSTQITVDGGSVVDNIVGTTVQNFSQEIVQEFQIGISNFDLSSGASASGTVNVVSRSGSNEYHGNGYVYWRDASFAALPSLFRLDAANGLPSAARATRIPFDREQFGGTIGGPIKKDKLFFFFNTEYNNQDGTAIHNTSSTAPSFSGFTPNPFNELLLTGKVDWNINNTTNAFVRYSHDDNDQSVPFPSSAGVVPRTSTSGIFSSNDQVTTNRSDGFVVGVTHSFSSNLVNDIHYNYNNFKNVIQPASPATGGLGELRIFNNATDQDWRSGTNYLTPQITTQVRNQIKDDVTYARGKHTFHFGGDYERTAIGGQFAFAKPSRVRLLAGPDSGGPLVLNTEAEFLAAPVRDITMGIGSDKLPFNTPGNSTNNNRFSFYGSDNWKIGSRFSLNYGLAYRIDSNLWNHDLAHPSIIAPLFTGGTAPSKRDTNNFGPRVGFAWDVAGNGKTVVRGGFGMYYDTAIDNLRLFERADLGPPGSELFLVGSDIKAPVSLAAFGGDGRFSANPASSSGYITLAQLMPLLPAIRKEVESVFSNCKLPTSLECGAAAGLAPSGPFFSSTFQIPYSIQYAAGVQKELPGKMVLQADFNYRKGLHEVLVYDANLSETDFRTVGPSLRRLPGFENSVPYADSSGFSTYKALLMRLDRRFSNGFQMTASYTFSRFKAFGSDTLGLGESQTNLLNLREDFGPAALDRTHRLVVSAIYQLPFFAKSSSGFKKNVLGGYTVSLISTTFSGLPLSVFLPNFANLSGTTFDASSYLPGTGAGSIGRSVKSVSQLNNLITQYNQNISKYAAGKDDDGNFIDPFGDVLEPLSPLPTNTRMGGDSVLSQDLRVTKSFKFRENVHLDLIGEVFNLFNFANLTNVNNLEIPTKASVADPSFGGFTTFRSTQRSSSVFGTGGPRAFQFAAKFTF
ncbi:MAG: hypothetical protein QOH96_2454, partial [Blastocatellia bacterium]|nr:hypothetical protein [Blastocatellia bacterium]